MVGLDKAIPWVIGMGVACCMFFAFLLFLSSIFSSEMDELESITYMECCNGTPCTDTYYTAKDNLCHLVLCEQSFFTNKSDCVYEGKNIINNNEDAAR